MHIKEFKRTSTSLILFLFPVAKKMEPSLLEALPAILGGWYTVGRMWLMCLNDCSEPWDDTGFNFGICILSKSAAAQHASLLKLCLGQVVNVF